MSNSETFGDNSLTLVTAGGPIIKVKVIAGPSFSGGEEGHQAEWSILVEESNLTDLINGLFPPPVLISSGGNLFSIKPPNQLLPNSGVFYARSHRSTPFEAEIGDPFRADPNYTDDYPTWRKTWSSIYRVDISFGTSENGKEEGSDTQDPGNIDTLFDSKSVDVSGQFLRVGDHNVKWRTAAGAFEDNDDLHVGITIPVPQITHSLHRKRVLRPDWETIASKLGNVNSQAATLANMGIVADAECLMFVGLSGTTTGVWSDQNTLWDMQYKFIQRQFQDDDNPPGTITWNHFYRPSAAAWQRLKIVSGGQNKDVFVKSDLSAVFRSV